MRVSKSIWARVDEATRVLNDEDAWLGDRTRAMRGLQWLGITSSAALKAMVAMTASASEWLREMARKNLQIAIDLPRLDDLTESEIRRRWDDRVESWLDEIVQPHSFAHWKAEWFAWWKIRDARLLTGLIELVEKTDDNAQWMAMTALGEFGRINLSTSARDKLLTRTAAAILSHDNKWYRNACIAVLRHNNMVEAAEVVGFAMLNDREDHIQHAAAECLEAWGQGASLALEEAIIGLSFGDDVVRRHCIRVIGNCGKSVRCFKALQKVADEDAPHARDAAIEAMADVVARSGTGVSPWQARVQNVIAKHRGKVDQIQDAFLARCATARDVNTIAQHYRWLRRHASREESLLTNCMMALNTFDSPEAVQVVDALIEEEPESVNSELLGALRRAILKNLAEFVDRPNANVHVDLGRVGHLGS